MLLFLANNPEQNRAADIVRGRGMSKGHVSSLLRSLEDRGLVACRADGADRRAVHLALTDGAGEIAEDGRAVQREFIRRLREDHSGGKRGHPVRHPENGRQHSRHGAGARVYLRTGNMTNSEGIFSPDEAIFPQEYFVYCKGKWFTAGGKDPLFGRVYGSQIDPKIKARDFMSKETNQDMGTGSVKKLMVQMAVPAVVGQVINLLYNVVDRIYIGHIPEIGGAALTGVGLFTPILMLITAFAMLAGAGGAPRAAIAMGKGDRDTAEKIVANCFTVLLLLSVVLTGVFYVTLPTLVRLFGGSDVTLPYAVQYGRIYVLGSVFVLVVMGMNPFITTQGFAGTSMLTTVIGAVINIVLDPIFIFVFDMGVAGAAIATV